MKGNEMKKDEDYYIIKKKDGEKFYAVFVFPDAGCC